MWRDVISCSANLEYKSLRLTFFNQGTEAGVLQNTQNLPSWTFHVVVFAEDSEEVYTDL